MPENSPRIYRASEAPIAMACPASVHPEPGEVVIDSHNDAALVGTATHKCCQVMVDNHAIPDFGEVLKEYELTKAQVEEVKMLTFAAWAFWSANFQAFGGGVETEKALRWGQLSGHMDVFSMPFNDEDEPDLAYVLDWKTTRLDVNYTPQMLVYASLAMVCFDKIRRVKTVIVYLRDRTADIREWSQSQVLEFSARFNSDVVRWPDRAEKVYRPGGHCSYCRRFMSCPAQRALVQSIRFELGGPEVANLPTEPDRIVALYERVGLLSKRIDQFKAAVRSKVENEGPIQGTDKRLVIATENRDEIDARLGWPVITRAVDDDQLADCLKVKKSQLLELVADSAPPRGKKKAKDDFMEELRAAGAVETKDIKKLRLMQGQAKEVAIPE